MKVRIITLFIYLLASATAFGQLKGFGLGPYIETGSPLGVYKDDYNKGVGAGFAAEIKIPGKISATGSAGVMRFGSSQDGEDHHSLTGVPMRFGLKFRLPVVYFKFESGVVKTKDVKDPVILSPGIGIRLLGLDVQASYESWMFNKPYSFGRIRAAYFF